MTMQATSTPVRMFAVYPKVVEPRSSRALEEIGVKNLELTKAYGLDYDRII